MSFFISPNRFFLSRIIYKIIGLHLPPITERKALNSKGFDVIAGSTNPAKAEIPLGVKAVRMVYEEPDSVDTALKGVSGLFLMAPPMDPEAPSKLIPIIDKAKAAGVDHIVFNSALGVDYNEEVPLRII